MSINPLQVIVSLTTIDPTILIEQGWFDLDIRVSLIIFFVVKTIMLALVTGLPAPVGLFLPTLAAGAAFGRLFGEIFVSITGDRNVLGINQAGYAVIGAACYGSSVTQTLSTAVVVMELLGNVRLLMPVLCATIVSFLISRFLTNSIGIYERLAFDRNLPFLFDLPVSKYGVIAEDMMTPIDWSRPTEGKAKVLASTSSLDTINEILDGPNFDPRGNYAVVDSMSNKMLIGFVSCLDLLRFRSSILKKMAKIPNFQEATQVDLLTGSTDNVSQSSLRRSLFQKISDSVELKFSRVKVTISEKSPIRLVHHLFSINKSDVIPVCDKGRLVGLVFRGDLIQVLAPKRYWHLPSITGNRQQASVPNPDNVLEQMVPIPNADENDNGDNENDDPDDDNNDDDNGDDKDKGVDVVKDLMEEEMEEIEMDEIPMNLPKDVTIQIVPDTDEVPDDQDTKVKEEVPREGEEKDGDLEKKKEEQGEPQVDEVVDVAVDQEEDPTTIDAQFSINKVDI